MSKASGGSKWLLRKGLGDVLAREGCDSHCASGRGGGPGLSGGRQRGGGCQRVPEPGGAFHPHGGAGPSNEGGR
eukprot:g10483.t1